MFLPISGHIFSLYGYFPIFGTIFNGTSNLFWFVPIHTVVKILLYTFCSILFFDWGITATADNSLGSCDAVMDFWYSFTWSSLCPIFIALTLSNKIIIELSNVVFVQFPIACLNVKALTISEICLI